jgi:ADP-ribosylglycohydrolase
VGDTLGGPVEFWTLDQILDLGPEGVQAYEPELVDGKATTDGSPMTRKMTLFTVEGIIGAFGRTTAVSA